ncbi:hypothetical protein GE061_014972 [Apolygus lucorum]|uniref:Uncharacterized protein n=1 Tax=Apolygus lucorum TaxID=248454 RepID=A0A8S9XJS4_APOLU|nr:hypothetical protein GE061_014972 [Apolygus lucorum]
MDVHRLLKDELQFELKIRKLSPDGTQAELRKRMRSAVAQKLPIHPDVIEALDKEIEIESCTNKYDYLVTAFEECESTSFTAADVKRLESRLIHVYTRVKLLGSEGTTLIKKVNDLYAKLQDVAKMSISDSLEAYDTEDAVAAVRPANRDPKIYKWGLTYSGDVPNVSLGSFVSPLPSGYVMDLIGRRNLLIIFNLLTMISWILLAFSKTPFPIYIAKFIAGMWPSIYERVEHQEEPQPRDLGESLEEEDHSSSEPGRDRRVLPVFCEIDSGRAMPVAGDPGHVPCVPPDRVKGPFRETSLTDDNHDMRDSMGRVMQYHSRQTEPIPAQERTGEAAAVVPMDGIVDDSASIGEDAPEMRAANREDWSTMEDKESHSNRAHTRYRISQGSSHWMRVLERMMG